MNHGVRRHHTAAMGPHPRQQSTQQSTNIIYDGSTSLKLKKKYLLLVIWLLMHIALMTTSDDNDAATKRWASLSPQDNIADCNGMSPLPTILSTRAGGGWKGGRGLRTSYFSATKGAHRDTRFFSTTRCLCLHA